MIRSTSPRFKKFLSALISLDFRSNFTKCVIKLFNPKNFKKIFCEFSGRATGYILMQINIRYDFGVHSKMSYTWNGFFKCSKSTLKKYNFKKRNQWVSYPWVVEGTCKKQNNRFSHILRNIPGLRPCLDVKIFARFNNCRHLIEFLSLNTWKMFSINHFYNLVNSVQLCSLWCQFSPTGWFFLLNKKHLKCKTILVIQSFGKPNRSLLDWMTAFFIS